MAANNFKPLERPQYWQGQALLSSDFNALLDSAEQLRWWHNRAEHAPFGIGFGLSISVADGAMRLACGVAYDCFGRELVIDEERHLTPPALIDAAGVYLALAWNGTRAELSWLPPGDLGRNPGVLLGRVKSDGTLAEDFRPLKARALARLRLAGGATPPGNTPWEKITNAQGNPIGLRTRIDTSSAGFTEVPFYVVSLCWTKGNVKFSEPLVTIAGRTPDSLTVGLILQGIGQESFEVAADIVTIDKAQWSNHAVAAFLKTDIVARVLPRTNAAVRIDTVAADTNKLTLGADPGLKKGGFAALLNPSSSITIEPTGIQSIRVDNPAQFPAGTQVLRQAGTTAGSAGLVDHVANGLLVMNSTLAGLKPGDQLATLKPVAKVASVNGTEVTVVDASSVTPGATLVRLSDKLADEIPVSVATVDLPNNILHLSVAIPGLKKDQSLGTPAVVETVRDVLATAFTTATPEMLQAGDVLSDGSRVSTIKRLAGNQLDLDAVLQFTTSLQAELGNFGPGSTIPTVPLALSDIPVENPAIFKPGDTVALRNGAVSGAVALGRVKTVGANSIQLVAALTPTVPVNAGDVISIVRFGAHSPVESIAPLKVHDPGKFRVGDLVTNDSAANIAVAEIIEIQADGTIILKGADLHPAIGRTLTAIFVASVPTVTEDPVGQSIIVSVATAARAGSYAAAVDHWIDASAPVTLDAFPDGVLPGDSIGHAAVSASQNVLRFLTESKVSPSTLLFVEGPDERTGMPQQAPAFINQLSPENQATLNFLGAPTFAIRPEQISIVSGFSANLTDDFVAYAQDQSLSICWLGCQIPHPPPAQCPGIPAASTCSCQ